MRAVWIEIGIYRMTVYRRLQSLSVRAVWIEILLIFQALHLLWSLSVRAVWIEILTQLKNALATAVTVREGSVD